MSMIGKLLDDLRTYADDYSQSPWHREIDGTIELLEKAANAIEALSEKLANMERSENCGGWILCSTGKMPHGGSSVLIRLKSINDGITGDDDRTYDISFLRTTDNEWVSTQGTYTFDAVLAWKPIEPYHEP